jgi:hypothetical protein
VNDLLGIVYYKCENIESAHAPHAFIHASGEELGEGNGSEE